MAGKWKQATNLVTTRFSRRVDAAPLVAPDPVPLVEPAPKKVRAPHAPKPFAIPLTTEDRRADGAAPRAVLERIKRAVAVRTPKPPKPARPVGRPRKDPNVLAVDARERIPGSISHAEMAQLREVATAAGMTPSALVQEIVRLYLSSV